MVISESQGKQIPSMPVASGQAMMGRLMPWKALKGMYISRLGPQQGRCVPWKAFTVMQRTKLQLYQQQQAKPKTKATSRSHRKQRSPILAASKKTQFMRRRSAPWKALTGIQRSRLGLIHRDQVNPDIYHQYHQQKITNQIHQAVSHKETTAPPSVSKTVLSSATLNSGLPQTPAIEVSSLPKASPSRSALDMPSLVTREPRSTSLDVLHSSKARRKSNCTSSPASPHTQFALPALPNVSPTLETQQKSICTSFSTAAYTSSMSSLTVAPTSYTPLRSNCTPSSTTSHTPSSLPTSLDVPPTSEMTTKSHTSSSYYTASHTSLSYLSGEKPAPQTAASLATFGSQYLCDDETDARNLTWVTRIPIVFDNIQKALDSMTSSIIPNVSELKKRRARIDQKIKKLQKERDMIVAMEKRARTVEKVVHTLDRELARAAIKVSQWKKSLRQSSCDGQCK